MLELLIAFSCKYGDTAACNNALTGYYKQIGLEQLITQKSIDWSNKHELESAVLTVGTGLARGVVVVPLGHSRSMEINRHQNLLTLKTTF